MHEEVDNGRSSRCFASISHILLLPMINHTINISCFVSSAYQKFGEGLLDDWSNWISQGVGVKVEGQD